MSGSANEWAQHRPDPRDAGGGGDFALAVKASVAVAGYAHTAGCPVFAEHVADVDAGIVAELRRRGGRVVGTTTCDELTFGVTGANAWSGPPLNPVDPGRIAGGSSGGSAAAIALGGADLAVGTGTGGSVSIPASLCGVVGFRPTTGRYPAGGLFGMSWTRDTPGLFARSVAEIDTADGWLTGRGARPAPQRPRRVGVPQEFATDLHPATRAAWEAARATAGIESDLVDVSLADVLRDVRRAAWPTIGFESRQLFALFAAAALGLAPEAAWERLLDGVATPKYAAALRRSADHPVTPEEYAETMALVSRARAAYAAVLDAAGVDVLLFPTTPRPATRIDADDMVEHGGERVHVFTLLSRHVVAGTLLRAPMLTLPLAVGPGDLPVGVTVQGRPFGDEAVLAAGAGLAPILAS